MSDMTSDREPQKIDPAWVPPTPEEHAEEDTVPLTPSDDGRMSRMTAVAIGAGRAVEPSLTVQHADPVRDRDVKVWFSVTNADGTTAHVGLRAEEAAAIARYALSLTELPWTHGARTAGWGEPAF